MFKRILLLLLCICLCLSVGCNKNPESLSVDVGNDVSTLEPIEEDKKSPVNPLTGLTDIDKGKENDRPIAITINNISQAQSVQTGLSKADIVYETEVEGGITRLVALFQDITKIKDIGTVRSARYAFIDIALGHNAIYVHHGQDSSHAGTHLNDVDRLVLDVNNAGYRASNGLAREHTLYGNGEKIWQSVKDAGFKTENNSSDTWVEFAKKDEKIKFANIGNSVTVPFSPASSSKFVYNTDSGKYTRYFNGSIRKDYKTGEAMEFKNVFLLHTEIYTYPNCNDGYKHQKVELNAGSGYYFVNGTYTVISWKKGNSKDAFEFTAPDGSPLVVEPGNSWVCIANRTSLPIIE